MTNYIEVRTNEEQTEVLSSYLPANRCTAIKNNTTSNYRKLLSGLAPEFRRVRNTINTIREDYFPETTTQFIENWEKQLNIPDDCIEVANDIEQRRKNVMLKLNSINISTNKEIENMLAAAGVNATVQNALDISLLPLTLPFILVSQETAPFTIIITLDASLQPAGLPLTLPFTLSSQAPANIECLLKKYIPAHCQVFFRYA
jgi:uncharacterized protein YmfQ (DUF2313 family)